MAHDDSHNMPPTTLKRIIRYGFCSHVAVGSSVCRCCDVHIRLHIQPDHSPTLTLCSQQSHIDPSAFLYYLAVYVGSPPDPSNIPITQYDHHTLISSSSVTYQIQNQVPSPHRRGYIPIRNKLRRPVESQATRLLYDAVTIARLEWLADLG